MKRRGVPTTIAAAALLSFGIPTIVTAQTPASSADDICGPAVDPCIISDHFDVQPPGDLDFGTRTVRITNGGKLLKTSTITCGDFIVDAGSGSTVIDTSETGNIAGSFTLNASGSVTIDGQIRARGNPGGLVRIRADGDITVESKILADGSPVGSPGGEIEMESFNGSITINDTLNNKATKGTAYETEQGGTVDIRADLDIFMNGAIDASGGQQGGSALVFGGRDVIIRNDIDAGAGPNIAYGQGGGIFLSAGEQMTVAGSGPNQTGNVKLNATGSLGFYTGGGYIYAYVGPGGYTYIDSEHGDVFVSKEVKVTANSGAGSKYGSAQGGVMYLRAYEGQVYTGGELSVNAFGEYGNGGFVFIEGYEALIQGPQGDISTRAKYGGGVNVRVSGYGPESRIDGKVDVRGRLRSGAYYSTEGSGGYFFFYGDTVDLGIDGKILGGAESSGEMGLGMCRLNLGDTATIDNSLGSPDGGGSIYINAYETMYAAPGSRIIADAQGGGEVTIEHRETRPPVLLGTVQPEPDVSSHTGWLGCNVCGNSELDVSETCDDGNTTPGDGCNEDCVAELCLAQTAPGESLCDDGDACTLNLCDEATGCSNPVSCEEGIACTIDSCNAGSCDHTPDDSACDDFNDCTDDVCSPATGCVYANLTGPSCEDGDICTVTGTCDEGACVPTDFVSAEPTKMKFKFRSGVDDDLFVAATQLPLAEFNANPSVTGLLVLVRDSDDQLIYSSDIPASAWVDKDGTKFTFKDSKFEIPSANHLRSMKISRLESKGIAKVRLKTKGVDVDGADNEFRISMSLLFGTDPAVDDCLTARFVPCDPATEKGKNVCKD